MAELPSSTSASTPSSSAMSMQLLPPPPSPKSKPLSSLPTPSDLPSLPPFPAPLDSAPSSFPLHLLSFLAIKTENIHHDSKPLFLSEPHHYPPCHAAASRQKLAYAASPKCKNDPDPIHEAKFLLALPAQNNICGFLTQNFVTSNRMAKFETDGLKLRRSTKRELQACYDERRVTSTTLVVEDDRRSDDDQTFHNTRLHASRAANQARMPTGLSPGRRSAQNRHGVCTGCVVYSSGRRRRNQKYKGSAEQRNESYSAPRPLDTSISHEICHRREKKAEKRDRIRSELGSSSQPYSCSSGKTWKASSRSLADKSPHKKHSHCSKGAQSCVGCEFNPGPKRKRMKGSRSERSPNCWESELEHVGHSTNWEKSRKVPKTRIPSRQFKIVLNMPITIQVMENKRSGYPAERGRSPRAAVVPDLGSIHEAVMQLVRDTQRAATSGREPATGRKRKEKERTESI